MKRARIFISGIVQGVFFRQNTMIKANELGLTGWVRNLKDGRVEVLCEGKEEAVEELIKWCKIGPRHAYVEHTEINWEEYKGEFSSFEIRY
jgi:acylphosphatase